MSIKQLLNRLLIFLIVITISVNYLSAQTGPGGVGNSSGTNGQPNNKLWFDASYLGLSNNTSLTTFFDRSGNANDASQSNATYRPIYYDATEPGYTFPIIYFDGTDDFMPFDGSVIAGKDYTVIYVGQRHTDGLNSIGLGGTNTGTNNNLHLFWTSSQYRAHQYGNDLQTDMVNNSEAYSGGTDQGEFGIFITRLNSSDGSDQRKNYQNNHYLGALSSSNQLNSWDGAAMSRAIFGTSHYYAENEIAEVIIYSTALNSAQLEIVNNYLSEKYSITIDNDKYTSADAAYNYDVAGIGHEADGNHTQAESGGLYIYEYNSTLANGEYVMFGNANTVNNSTTKYTGGDLPSGTVAAWARQYYIEKTSTDGIDVKLIFDFKEALSDGGYPANVSNYVLLYRSTKDGSYSKVTTVSQGIFDVDQVYFNVEDANFSDGYYTIGSDDQTNSPVEGVAGRTWYALASGDWDNSNYWTLDPSGSLPNNPNNETPNSIDKVVIQTGKTITVSANTKTVVSITVDGILQLGTTSGHDFTEINGSGRIKLSSNNFPLGDKTNFVTAGEGEGTVVYEGSGYSLTNSDTFFNVEIKQDNNTDIISLENDLTINGSLNIEKGILRINDNTDDRIINLSVAHDVLVETNQQITVGTGNTFASSAYDIGTGNMPEDDGKLYHDIFHQFTVGGNFTNNGIVQLTNQNAPDYNDFTTTGGVTLKFTGMSNNTFSCSGTTDLYNLVIDKGTDKTYILTVSSTNVDNFKLFGANSCGRNTFGAYTSENPQVRKALFIPNGTLKLTGSIYIPTLSEGRDEGGNGDYAVGQNACFWIAGSGVTVYSTADHTDSIPGYTTIDTYPADGVNTGTSNQAMSVYGKFKQDAGFFGTQNSAGFIFWSSSNAQVEINGGTVNIAQLRSAGGAAGIASYKQTGGVLIARGDQTQPGEYSGSYALFGLETSDGVFQMSGGEIQLLDEDGDNDPEFYLPCAEGNYNVTGGKITVKVSAGRNFQIYSVPNIWDMQILQLSGTGTTKVQLENNLIISHDLTINDNCELDVEDPNTAGTYYNVAIGEDFNIIEGATYSYGENTTIFNGTEDGEFYIGHNIDDNYEQYLYNLTVNKTEGKKITIIGDPNKDPDNVSDEYYNRLVHVVNDLNVISGILDQGRQSIRLFEGVNVKKEGQLGTYENGITPRTAYIMFRDGDLTIYSEKDVTFGNIKFNSTGIVTFTSDVYIKRIGFYKGLYNIGTYNLKVDYLHKNSTENNYTVANGSASEMIYGAGNASDGGLSLLVTGNATYNFPIGVSGKYTPAAMTLSNYSDDGYVTINPVDEVLPTTNQGGGSVLSYYWHVEHSGFSTLPKVSELIFTGDESDEGDNPPDRYSNSWRSGKVLSELPFTRSVEDNTSINNPNGHDLNFDGDGTPFDLENADYSCGNPSRFNGTPDIFYTYKSGDAFTLKWDDGNNWTYGLDATYDPHDSRQVAAGDYPKAGDIAVIGWVPYGDPGGTDGDPQGIAVDGISVDFALISFTQMEDISGNPTARQYAYNFQFRPTVVINDAGGALNGSRVSGEGLFWMRWGASQADPDFSNIDIGDFINQDSSYFVYESKSGVFNNVPSEVPNLLIAGDGWGANDRDFELATDLKVNSNFELLGDVNLILSSGATGDVIVDKDLRIFRSKAKGHDSGGFGRIDYPNDTIRSIEVYGDLRLENEGAIIRVANPNTTVNESNLILHGNIIQDNTSGGGVQLYSADNEDYIKLTLKGAGNNAYTVTSGAIANFYNIEFNKGTDQTSTFTFSDDFNLNGPTSGAGIDKALELRNGSLILDDPNIDIDLTTGDDDFVIHQTVCLEVKQGKVNVSGDDSGIYLDGKLRVSGGTVDMDDGAGNGNNYIEYSSSGNATLEITGGSLIVGSQIRRKTTTEEGVLTYIQSGGTVIVGKNIAPVNDRGVFEILNAGSSFTHSGGNLQIVRQQTNPTFATLYLAPETSNLTAGTTIILGNASTPAYQEFGIYSTINLQNLTLDNTSTNNPVAKMWTVPLTLYGELTIQNLTEFKANGLDLNCYGDFTNVGTFTANQNTTYFKGSTDQKIDGNTTFYNLTNQNTANLNLASGNTDIIIDNVLNLENGTFNDNSNDVFVYGDINNEATHVYGGSGDGITMLGTSQQIMTGNGTYGKLTINNGNDIVLPVGNAPTITNYLKMESGVFRIGGNLLTLGINCIIQEANPFGVNNMIGTNISFTDYGVKKYFPSGAGSFTYPVGSVSGTVNKYTPVVVTVTQNTNTNGYLIVKPADEIHPSIIDDSEGSDPDIVDMDNVLQYYWVLTANGFTGGSGKVEMYYDTNDVEVTAPYDVYDYITAKLLNDGTGNWSKFDDVTKFDESDKKIIFDFSDAADIDMNGDYTAGVDGSTFLGAIPDQVPLYVSKGIAGGGPFVGLDWNTADTWRVDDGTGTWVTPASMGLPDIPNGSRVRIVSGDRVTTAANYISDYTTDILGTLDLGTTFANRLGNVTGTGTLYSERGTLPGGYYEDFFLETGGTLEFGGSDDYSVLSNIAQINNIIFSGTGQRELPNLDLIVLGDFTIDGDDATLKVINEFDNKLDLRRDVVFNNGAFDAGIGVDAIVEFNGTSGSQIISGTGGFTGTNAFNHVIMNNTDGITFSIPVDIDQTLKFDNGVIHTDATNILKLTNTTETIVTGAGSNKFVDGPLSKNINSGGNFNFPVGNVARYGATSVLSSNVAGYWIAEYLNHNPNNDGYDPTVFSSPLQTVSNNEYWRIKAPANATAKVKIRWDLHSGVPTDAANRNDLRIAKWTDLGTDAWTELDASNTIAGDQNNGTVVQTNTTSFNEFGTGNFFTLSSTYTPNLLSWDGSESIIWNNADNWTPAKIPTAADSVLIPSSGVTNEPTIDISAICNSLDLQTGRTLTINAGKSLTAYGNFTLNGTLVLETPTGNGPSASFIDNGTISGSGTMHAKRLFTGGKFHYLSSPIQAGGNANSNLFTTSHPDGNFNVNFYYYDETYDIDGDETTAPEGAYNSLNFGNDVWIYAHNNDNGAVPVNLDVHTGYAFYTTVDQTISFVGTPNTGDMSISNLTYTLNDSIADTYPNAYDGWELVANPYPSAIDWDVIKTDLTNLDEGIYVWDGTQYASYVNGVQGGSGNLSNEIAPMQAFFVHTNADNAGFTLNNSARIHSSSNYLKKKSKNQDDIKENYIRLKLAGNGYNDYSAIYFISKATNKFDSKLETYKMFSPDYMSGIPHIFSISGKETPVAINALPEIKFQEKTVPLGIRINTSGTYTIFVDEFNFANSKVFLIDKQENTEICLNDVNSYSFDFVAGDDRNRFELKFIKNSKPLLNIELYDFDAYEDDILDLKLSDNTFIDYDKDDYITYSARLSNNNQLPSWMKFNNLNVTFSGTPNNDYVGIYDIELKATDRFGAFGTTMFRLNIINVNDIPTLVNQIPDMTTNLGDYYSYNIPSNTFMDIDLGDELVLSAKLFDGSDLPNWLSFDPLNNTLSGVSENLETLNIVITATDNSGAKNNSSFKLTVKNTLNNNSNSPVIYPNPTTGKFSILNFKGTVIITDIKGKVIIKRESVNDIEKFDISNYPTGNYLIKLISEDDSEEKIIIKQ